MDDQTLQRPTSPHELRRRIADPLSWSEVDCLFDDDDDLPPHRLIKPPTPIKRRVALPRRIDRADIRTTLRRGVVQITVPKIVDPAARKGEIETPG